MHDHQFGAFSQQGLRHRTRMEDATSSIDVEHAGIEPVQGLQGNRMLLGERGKALPES